MKHLIKTIFVLISLIVSHSLHSALYVAGLNQEVPGYCRENRIEFSNNLIKYSGLLKSYSNIGYLPLDISHDVIEKIHFYVSELDSCYARLPFKKDIAQRECSPVAIRMQACLERLLKLDKHAFIELFKAADYFQIPEITVACAALVGEHIDLYLKEGRCTLVNDYALSNELLMRVGMYVVQLNLIFYPKPDKIVSKLKSAACIVAFLPDGQSIISSSNGKILLSRADTDEEINGFDIGITLSLPSFSQDGLKIVFGSMAMDIEIYDTTNGEITNVLKGHDDWASSAQYSCDGTKVISTCGHEIRIWDAESGKQLKLLHSDSVKSASFSPDGSQIVSVGNEVIVWHVDSGEQLQRFSHDDPIMAAAAFSSDGQSVVTASGVNAIMWDVITGNQLQCFSHPSIVSSVKFSPNGSLLLSTAWDGKVRIWHTRTGKLLQKIYADRLVSANFSPDGSKVVTGGCDGRVIVWSLVPRNWCELSKKMTFEDILHMVSRNQINIV